MSLRVGAYSYRYYLEKHPRGSVSELAHALAGRIIDCKLAEPSDFNRLRDILQRCLGHKGVLSSKRALIQNPSAFFGLLQRNNIFNFISEIDDRYFLAMIWDYTEEGQRHFEEQYLSDLERHAYQPCAANQQIRDLACAIVGRSEFGELGSLKQIADAAAENIYMDFHSGTNRPKSAPELAIDFERRQHYFQCLEYAHFVIALARSVDIPALYVRQVNHPFAEFSVHGYHVFPGLHFENKIWVFDPWLSEETILIKDVTNSSDYFIISDSEATYLHYGTDAGKPGIHHLEYNLRALRLNPSYPSSYLWLAHYFGSVGNYKLEKAFLLRMGFLAGPYALAAKYKLLGEAVPSDVISKGVYDNPPDPGPQITT